MLASLDADTVRRWCAEGLAALRRHQGEIDALNVFPVPDGDTGTNLVLTMESAAAALDAEPDDVPPTDGASAVATEAEVTRLGRVLRCMARGALLGARGNSGVIVSQILRGIADAVGQAPELRGRALAAALRQAADAGYAAVAAPVEGTVLSVARAAADAAASADSDELGEVTAAAARGAAVALDRTPEQLEALAWAGVVDAGGRGLVVLLDALDAVVRGTAPATAPLARMAADPSLLDVRREESYAYEVQYLLDAPAHAVETLKGRLVALGDSLVVVGTGAEGGAVPTWNVHVHVDDVGAAIEAGVENGRPHRISVTRFLDQITGRGEGVPGCAVPPAASPPNGTRPAGEAGPSGRPVTGVGGRGVVVVAAGPGLARLFAAEGAVVVQGSPSTRDLLAAIEQTGAAHVAVLPNDGATLQVADAAAAEARAAGREVSVLHTRSPVQAVAALAVADAARGFAEDVLAMAEAAAATRTGGLATAARDSLTVAGPCRAGDVLGLADGEVVLIGRAWTDVGAELLDRLLGSGGELVTLVTGADAPARLADALVAHVAARWPFVECQILDGGQPHYPVLLGVE